MPDSDEIFDDDDPDIDEELADRETEATIDISEPLSDNRGRVDFLEEFDVFDDRLDDVWDSTDATSGSLSPKSVEDEAGDNSDILEPVEMFPSTEQVRSFANTAKQKSQPGVSENRGLWVFFENVSSRQKQLYMAAIAAVVSALLGAGVIYTTKPQTSPLSKLLMILLPGAGAASSAYGLGWVTSRLV